MASRSGATRRCSPSEDDTDDATAADAARFCAALAERLQVDPSLINPAYEDIHYYLWREHRLPANVLAEDAKLKDPLERARLARVFGQGLGAPVGIVLPLRRAIRDGVARLAERQVAPPRRTRCSCCPAIQPIGYRLPLESLPWADEETVEQQTRAPIRSRRGRRCRRCRPFAVGAAPIPMGAGAEGFRPVAAGTPGRSAVTSPTWCAPR